MNEASPVTKRATGRVLSLTALASYWGSIALLVIASILVGFDPRSADRAPVTFGSAAARLTASVGGAPLVGRLGHGAGILRDLPRVFLHLIRG